MTTTIAEGEGYEPDLTQPVELRKPKEENPFLVWMDANKWGITINPDVVEWWNANYNPSMLLKAAIAFAEWLKIERGEGMQLGRRIKDFKRALYQMTGRGWLPKTSLLFSYEELEGFVLEEIAQDMASEGITQIGPLVGRKKERWVIAQVNEKKRRERFVQDILVEYRYEIKADWTWTRHRFLVLEEPGVIEDEPVDKPGRPEPSRIPRPRRERKAKARRVKVSGGRRRQRQKKKSVQFGYPGFLRKEKHTVVDVVDMWGVDTSISGMSFEIEKVFKPRIK